MAYVKRENSYWIFSRELKYSNILEGEEKKQYVITPLGTKVKRILITGKITYKSSDDKMVKITVMDYIGSFYLTGFKTGFSSEIAEDMDKFNVNDTIIVMGKVSSFKNDEGIFYFSINPELIKGISELERFFWGIRATYVAKRKIYAIKELHNDENATEETLIKLGYTEEEAADAVRSKKYYNDYDYTTYLNTISSINYEKPEENKVNNNSNETVNTVTLNLDSFVLDYIKNNDFGPGCKYDDIVIAASNAGINRDKLDEILNVLGSNGDIYEVSLKRYKVL